MRAKQRNTTLLKFYGTRDKLPDYETLVTSGDQYLKDAEMFNNLMKEFTIKAKDVTISVENIN